MVGGPALTHPLFIGRILAVLWCCTSLSAAAQSTWQTLEGCVLIPHPYNDGDSFHVRHGSKEYIFRLCYVDAPETEDMKEFKDRLTAQGRYWGINRKSIYAVGHMAQEFAIDALKDGFTVRTDWTDAMGQSKKPRYFAVVQTPQGDLAEMLVSAGLARVYGYAPNYPNGKTGSQYMKFLRQVESRAKAKGAGAWAGSKALSGTSSNPKPKTDSPKPTQKKRPPVYVPAI